MSGLLHACGKYGMDIQTADAFHTARGNSDWNDAQVEEKSAALMRAEDYIDTYQLREGTENHPLRVKATLLLALEFLSGAPTLKQTAQIVKFKEDTAGALVEETEYGDTPVDPYPIITALLRPLMANGSSGITVMRVVR